MLRQGLTSQGSELTYQSFLLRCWLESDGEDTGDERWRFSVTEAEGPRRRWGCQGLDDLLLLLRDRLAEGLTRGAQPGDAGMDTLGEASACTVEGEDPERTTDR